MTIGSRDNRTNLVDEPNVLGFVVVLGLAHGCALVRIVSPDTQADLAAIVKVVNDVYRSQG